MSNPKALAMFFQYNEKTCATFTELSPIFSPKFYAAHPMDPPINSRKDHARELELFTYLRCF